MTTQNVSGAAMPTKDESIRKNSMKLYAYLVCLANPCDEHNRILDIKN